MQQVILNSHPAKRYAITMLMGVDTTSGMTMTIDNTVLSRRGAQNALLWMLYTDIQNTSIEEHAGTTKEEWHQFFKGEFLSNIYQRDVKEDGGSYANMIESLRNLYTSGHREEAKDLHAAVIRLTTTTAATVKQFSEYLGCIMSWANERGISYRLPEDIHNKAMDIK